MVNTKELRYKPISEIVEPFLAKDSIFVDLTKLAHTLNVSVLRHNFGKEVINGEKVICAFLTNGKGNSCIFYSDALLNNKGVLARMVIVQAFAKYIITGDESFYITHSTNFSNREKMLIHEMLMPETKVNEVINQLLLPTTYALADIFMVSQEFVRERLDEMHVRRLIGGYNY